MIRPWFYPSKLKALENRANPSDLLVAKDSDETGRKFFGWVRNHRELYNLIDQTDPDKRWYYENTTKNGPCPLFFDIDGDKNGDAYAESIVTRVYSLVKSVLSNVFVEEVTFNPEEDAYVLDAGHSTRLSMHVIVRFKNSRGDPVVLSSPADVDKFYTLMSQNWDDIEMPDEVDRRVARVGAFRLMNCMKRKPRAVKSVPFRPVFPERSVCEPHEMPSLEDFKLFCVTYVPDDATVLDMTNTRVSDDRPNKFMRLHDDGRHVSRVPMYLTETLPMDRTPREARTRMEEFTQDLSIPRVVCAEDVMELLSAYQAVNPDDDYDSWVTVLRNLKCMACIQSRGLPEHEADEVKRFYRGMMHAYSSRSYKYDYDVCEAKWESCTVDVDGSYDPMMYLFLKVLQTNDRDAVKLRMAVQYTTLTKLDMINWFGARLSGLYKKDPCQGIYMLDRRTNMWVPRGKDTSAIVNEFTDGVVGRELAERAAKYKGMQPPRNADQRLEAIENVIAAASTDIAVRRSIEYITEPGFAKVLDSDAYSISFTNCVLDLRTGVRRKITPADNISRNVGYSFTPCSEKEIEEVENVFKDILWSESVYRWVMQFMSTCLLGQFHPNMVFFTGVPDTPGNNGSNGKSTFVNWIMASLGQYASRLAGTALGTADISAPNAHTSHLNAMVGARATYAIEVPNNMKLNLDAMIKPVTGGDMIKLRGLGKEEMEVVLPVTMFATCNNLPSVETRDHATWRRLRAVWFRRWYTDAENVDPNNQYHAVSKGSLNTEEKARSMRVATMHLLLRHLRDYMNNDMELPKCEEIDMSTEDFRDSTDTLREFLETNFVRGTEEEVQEKRSWVTLTEIRNRARRVNFKTGRQREFKNEIEHHYGLKFVKEGKVRSRNPTEVGMIAQRKFQVLFGVSPILNFNDLE